MEKEERGAKRGGGISSDGWLVWYSVYQVPYLRLLSAESNLELAHASKRACSRNKKVLLLVYLALL